MDIHEQLVEVFGSDALWHSDRIKSIMQHYKLDYRDKNLVEAFMKTAIGVKNQHYKPMLTISWKEITPEDMPTGEVLAANKKTRSIMTGYLEKSSRSPTGYNCTEENNGELVVFINCTHYILKSDLLKDI